MRKHLSNTCPLRTPSNGTVVVNTVFQRRSKVWRLLLLTMREETLGVNTIVDDIRCAVLIFANEETLVSCYARSGRAAPMRSRARHISFGADRPGGTPPPHTSATGSSRSDGRTLS